MLVCVGFGSFRGRSNSPGGLVFLVLVVSDVYILDWLWEKRPGAMIPKLENVCRCFRVISGEIMMHAAALFATAPPPLNHHQGPGIFQHSIQLPQMSFASLRSLQRLRASQCLPALLSHQLRAYLVLRTVVNPTVRRPSRSPALRSSTANPPPVVQSRRLHHPL